MGVVVYYRIFLESYLRDFPAHSVLNSQAGMKIGREDHGQYKSKKLALELQKLPWEFSK